MKILLLTLFSLLTLSSIGQKTAEELLADGFQERGKKAIRLFTKAIKIDSNNAKAYWRRGDEYYRMKKYEMALKDLNKSLQVDSTFSFGQIISDRGQTFEMLHDYANAISDFTKAINYALQQDTTIPQSLEQYYYHRGRTKLKFSDTASAMRDLDSAIYFWQSHHFARALRAKTNCILGNYSAAMADYNYMLKKDFAGMDFPIDKEYSADFYYRGITKQHLGDSTYIDDLNIAKQFHYYPGKIIYVKGL
jgi:tetratricopeptide (TPR) repeat protein